MLSVKKNFLRHRFSSEKGVVTNVNYILVDCKGIAVFFCKSVKLYMRDLRIEEWGEL